jgi:hypothetical protein
MPRPIVSQPDQRWKFASALRDAFGPRALMIAERQVAAASGLALSEWSEVRELLLVTEPGRTGAPFRSGSPEAEALLRHQRFPTGG